jgi:hypothetical protein
MARALLAVPIGVPMMHDDLFEPATSIGPAGFERGTARAGGGSEPRGGPIAKMGT